MILLFGGTTEGRSATKALEESGSPFYYSTSSEGQEVEMVNGIRLSGKMDASSIFSFCKEHDIRLLVDAAHPFAENLHKNILVAASQLKLPVIRYERIYPERSKDIIWCDDFDDGTIKMEKMGIGNLLVLTGVKSISKLKEFRKHHDCFFRILDRDESKSIAMSEGVPSDHLLYYGNEDLDLVVDKNAIHAILTKESGLSGGFTDKVDWALSRGLQVFAISRPTYPPEGIDNTLQIMTVDGPHGLRRQVERLIPEFYPLHSGLTTGTCATAAAVAETIRQVRGIEPTSVDVVLPDGETISVDVCYGEGYACVFKVSGDDPDVTDGIEIRASISDSPSYCVEGGEGVGRFTLPGFDYPPGESAINRVPRKMILDNVSRYTSNPIRVVISVPMGEEIARRTFNPRLGIEGGISIIGVSGIVKPYSEEAFVESIRKCMEVAKASGSERIVLNSGGKSANYVQRLYPTLPRQAFVEYGNMIGETLKIADELCIKQITMGLMLGKAIKLAEGHLDTHSKKSTFNRIFIQSMIAEIGCDIDISAITLARELWNLVPSSKLEVFCNCVKSHCSEVCKSVYHQGSPEILLIDDEGEIH